MIEVDGLSKQFGPIAAVRDVSFRVEQGEIVGFLGPNGAGKTTTMRIVTGFSPASRGTARVAGFDVHADPVAVKQRVGYLPETAPLYPEMVTRGFLRYVAEIRGVPRRERRAEVDRVIERCGLTAVANRLVRHLSKGYRQRVGLAQALIGRPPVLILDEPTVGLDPRQIVEIRNLIQELSEQHTVLLSTHILPEVTMLCQRVLIIHQGRLVAQDAIDRLAGGDALEWLVVLDGPSATARTTLEAAPGAGGVTETGPGRYVVRGAAQDDLAPALMQAAAAAGLTVTELRRHTRSLEQIFLDVIASDAGGAS